MRLRFCSNQAFATQLGALGYGEVWYGELRFTIHPHSSQNDVWLGLVWSGLVWFGLVW